MRRAVPGTAPAVRTSGRLPWLATSLSATPSNSLSPTTLPPGATSVTRTPSAVPARSASESGSIEGVHCAAIKTACAAIVAEA